MRELGVVGLTEDQQFLVVRDLTSDEQFRVPLGDHVASALSSAGPAGSAVPNPSTGPEQRMDPIHLTPREIQARIRRGESPDDVASSAGVPVAQVEPFAGPVLAEREYMAQQAGRTTLRRRHAGSSALRLGSAVDDAVRSADASPDDVEWDAFRREDGRWTVLVTPPAGVTARFVYDVEGRYVVPDDEIAHELVGDLALPDSPDMALADVVRETGRRAVAADESPADPTPDTMAAPAQEPAPTGELQLELGLPADVAAAEALLDAPAYPPVSSLKEARDRRAQTALTSQHDEDASAEVRHDDLESSIDHDVAVPDHPQPKKRHERRRVPSWDEIMFGDKND